MQPSPFVDLYGETGRTFVNSVRENEEAGSENPIADAIDWCVENDVLKEFLSKRRKEVIKAMTIDMTFEAREEIIRQEEREQPLSVQQ